jgi:hypothetical protein
MLSENWSSRPSPPRLLCFSVSIASKRVKGALNPFRINAYGKNLQVLHLKDLFALWQGGCAVVVIAIADRGLVRNYAPESKNASETLALRRVNHNITYSIIYALSNYLPIAKTGSYWEPIKGGRPTFRLATRDNDAGD